MPDGTDEMEAMRRAGPALLMLGFALAWEVFAAGFGRGEIAAPLATVVRLWQLLGTASFQADMLATGRAFALAVVLSVAGGLLLAGLIGRNRLAVAVSAPVLVNLAAIPKVTLYPLVLLLFGLGIRAKVAFGVMHGLPPLALFTIGAMANVRPAWLRTAMALRLSPGQVLVRVVLPAILPEIAAGVRLAVSLCLLGVLIGEMFASSSGLGHRAMTAIETGDMAGVLATALLLAGFATAVNWVLLWGLPRR